MNSYDDQAQDAIEDYRKRHGSYPRYVEVTAEYREKLSSQELIVTTHVESMPGSTVMLAKVTRIPVIPIGGAHRHLLIREMSSTSISEACSLVHAVWNGERARILAAGCRITEPETNGGFLMTTPYTLYYQISAIIFGHENILQELASRKVNYLTNEQ